MRGVNYQYIQLYLASPVINLHVREELNRIGALLKIIAPPSDPRSIRKNARVEKLVSARNQTGSMAYIYTGWPKQSLSPTLAYFRKYRYMTTGITGWGIF